MSGQVVSGRCPGPRVAVRRPLYIPLLSVNPLPPCLDRSSVAGVQDRGSPFGGPYISPCCPLTRSAVSGQVVSGRCPGPRVAVRRPLYIPLLSVNPLPPCLDRSSVVGVQGRSHRSEAWTSEPCRHMCPELAGGCIAPHLWCDNVQHCPSGKDEAPGMHVSDKK